MISFLKTRDRSIRTYTLLAWLIPGAMAILICIGVFVGSAFVEKQASITALQSELSIKAQAIARRVSAEILIGPRGSVSSVIQNLKSELRLDDVSITTATPPCLEANANECTQVTSGKIFAFYKVPYVKDLQFVSVSVPAPGIGLFIKTSNLLWSTLPMAILLALGIFIQMFILKRFIIKPVQTLVETTTGNQEPKSYWPRELKEISGRLYKSFKVRDEVVFSQITRGVIHDLKTLIHAPLGAIDLVNEHSANLEKRVNRLEHMHKVVSTQLPKMQEIIDNTLDGSRDIKVKPILQDASIPIKGAIATLSNLSASSGVTVTLDSNADINAPIDKTQLERAITNIVKNGIEAAKDSSTIKGVVLSTKTEKDFLEINIEDSGPGLPKFSKDKLFTALRSTKTHGSGLGLIVSKKIIEAHGGRLIPGKSNSLGGAKFSIQIPISNQDAQLQGEVC